MKEFPAGRLRGEEYRKVQRGEQHITSLTLCFSLLFLSLVCVYESYEEIKRDVGEEEEGIKNETGWIYTKMRVIVTIEIGNKQKAQL